jgi:hypothetical protein
LVQQERVLELELGCVSAIAKDEQSGLLMRIAATESVALCVRMKS